MKKIEIRNNLKVSESFLYSVFKERKTSLNVLKKQPFKYYWSNVLFVFENDLKEYVQN